MRVYFGTYTGKSSRGIYMSEFDSATGVLKPAELAAESLQPSFLALHPAGKHLFAVNEVSDFQGKPAGAVTAFRIDAKTGRLTQTQQRSSGGGAPCHLTVDQSGRTLLVANYWGGSVASFPIQPDGTLGEMATFIQHTGKGTDPGRQEAPHAHAIYPDPSNRFAVVADLGLDRLLVYRLNSANGTLLAHDAPLASWTPAAGPRHFAFHPNGRWGYALNEMNSTITPVNYNAARGEFTPRASVSTLPPDFKGHSGTAEIFVHPSGRFVYGSNRGHDSIAVFRVNSRNGALTPVQHQSTGGKTPRGFGIDPSGRWLLAANQDSDTVCVFSIDRKTGLLQPTGQSIAVGTPVSVHFLARP